MLWPAGFWKVYVSLKNVANTSVESSKSRSSWLISVSIETEKYWSSSGLKWSGNNNQRRGRTKVNTVEAPGCETAVIRIWGLCSDVAIPLAYGRNISRWLELIREDEALSSLVNLPLMQAGYSTTLVLKWVLNILPSLVHLNKYNKLSRPVMHNNSILVPDDWFLWLCKWGKNTSFVSF